MLNRFKRDRIRKSKSGLFYKTIKGKKIYSTHQQILGNPLRKIIIEGAYDFNTQKDMPFIIDCGANIGLGIYFWKDKFPNSKIIAFEPSREVFAVLQQNVKNNDFQNVELHKTALSNKEGEVEFTSNESLSGSLELKKGLPNNYKVNVDRLSNYMNQPIDYLKIDIEGAEIDVLIDIEHKLHLVENLFIEYHSFVHKKQELAFIFEMLENKGFRYFVDGEYRLKSPLKEPKISLNQDLQIGIWAKK